MRDRAQQAERLRAIRLRYTINTHLQDQGVATPSAIGATVGLLAAEAARLLRRLRWRAGEVAARAGGCAAGQRSPAGGR